MIEKHVRDPQIILKWSLSFFKIFGIIGGFFGKKKKIQQRKLSKICYDMFAKHVLRIKKIHFFFVKFCKPRQCFKLGMGLAQLCELGFLARPNPLNKVKSSFVTKIRLNILLIWTSSRTWRTSRRNPEIKILLYTKLYQIESTKRCKMKNQYTIMYWISTTNPDYNKIKIDIQEPYPNIQTYYGSIGLK